MSTHNENIVTMQRAVVFFKAEQPASIKDTMPGYNNLNDLLNSKNETIGDLSGNQGFSLVGYRVNKSISKYQLVNQVITIVLAARAFATTTNDNVVANQMKPFSQSFLMQMRDTKTIDF